MNVMDILKSYVERPTDTQQDFDEVSRDVPQEALGQSLADAFRSDRTPEFGRMVGSLFGGSNPQLRAGLLGQLISAVGPSLIAGLGSGALGRLLKGRTTEISPEDAAAIDPDEVRDLASAAEKQDPAIMDRVGAYYAKHPEVVKVLGGSALAKRRIPDAPVVLAREFLGVVRSYCAPLSIFSSASRRSWRSACGGRWTA